MMPRQHQSPDQRRLAAALRELREETGLSAANFGAPLGWSQGKVSKIENGRTVPSPEDAERWAQAAGKPERGPELGALAESVAIETRRWGGRRHGALAARNEDIGLAEAASTVVREFQSAIIPGLLQTADYARRVMTLLDTEDDIAAAVNARMQRQDGLYRPGARFEFVLTEGALRWRPGSREMMAAQYDRLMRATDVESVDLRVLPFAAQAPILYIDGFVIYEIEEDPHVLVETILGEQVGRHERDLARSREAFRRCWDAALHGADAKAVIEGLVRELGTD